MRYLIILLFIGFQTNYIQSQNALLLQWEKKLQNQNGASSMQLNDILDNGNSLFIAGFSSEQTGNFMYLGNYSYSGVLIRDTILVTEGSSSLSKLLKTSDGSIYAMGREQLASGKNRIRLIKLNSDFDLILNISYSANPSLSYSFTDAVLWAEAPVICGFTTNESNTQNSLIVRFDTNLNPVWERNFDFGTFNWASSITVDDSGNFTLAGAANEGFSFLALHYNSLGDLIWQYPTNFTGGLARALLDGFCDAEGNIVLTGYEEDANNISVSAIVTIKLSATGNLLWQQSYTNQTECFAEHILEAPDGSICVAGRTTDLIVVISYTSDGVQQFLTSYNPDLFPSVNSIGIDALGNIFVASSGVNLTAVHFLNSEGEILNDLSFSTDELERVNKLIVKDTELFFVGYVVEASKGVLASMNIASFNESYFLYTEGRRVSNLKPGGLEVTDEFIWLSTVSESEDSTLFTVIKASLGGEIIWQRSISHEGIIPVFNFLKADNQGNIIGLYHPSQNVDGGAVHLVKYSPEGNLVFNTLINTEDLYKTGGLAIDDSGNIYITGVNNSNREMYLRMYSHAGEQQWGITYQSPATPIAVSIPFRMLLSTENKLIIAASHRGTNNINNLHVFQYSLSGELEWNRDVADQTGNFNDLADLIVLPEGKILAFGSSAITQTAVAMFDNLGNVIWNISENNAFSSYPRNAAVHNNGNTYLLFSTNNAVQIKKLSTNGTVLAEQNISLNTSGTFYFPYRCDIVNNQLVILGAHQIMQTDYPMGMIVSLELELLSGFVDSLSQGALRDAIIKPSGEAYASYQVSSSGSFNFGLLRRYSVGTPSIDAFVTDNHLTMFPNPSSDKINIVMTEMPVDIELYDYSGRVQKADYQSISNQMIQIDTSKLLNGLYYIRLNGRNSLYSGSFMVSH